VIVILVLGLSFVTLMEVPKGPDQLSSTRLTQERPIESDGHRLPHDGAAVLSEDRLRSLEVEYQRQMAEWSFWTLVLTSVGLMILVGTFVETVRTAGAAVDASTAAVESNRITRDHADRSLRAYVTLKHGHISLNVWPGSVNGLTPTVLLWNSGSTPAYEVTSWMKISVRPKSLPMPFEDVLPVDKRDGKSVCGSSCDINLSFTHSVSVEEVQSVLAGSSLIYVWGGVDYRDHAGVERRFVFRCVNAGGGRDDRGQVIWPLQPHSSGYEAD
jgi:hypothetical protein